MLEDEEDGGIMEWKNNRIYIHRPDLLEKKLLLKYFRHSKLTSFQRQLNYFGFHKVSGFGRLSPCSYYCNKTTSDIKSLLVLKRLKKTTAKQAVVKPRAAVKTAESNRLAAMSAGSLGIAMNGPPIPGMSVEELMVAESMARQDFFLRQQQQAHQDHRDAFMLNALAAAEQQRRQQYDMARLSSRFLLPIQAPTYIQERQAILNTLAVAEQQRRQPDNMVPWTAQKSSLLPPLGEVRMISPELSAVTGVLPPPFHHRSMF